jgi:hypothetical protein
MEDKTSASVNKLNGAITFLDILGWKGIWQRKSDAVQDLQNLSHHIEKTAQNQSRGLGSGIAASAISSVTRVLIISDTIVITTEATRSDAQSALELHGILCSEAIPNSINRGIPVRGATSFGEFSIDSEASILVGKAIDEAASWYELADWIGVFMSPSAAYLFNDSKSGSWLEYSPPLKDSIDFKTYAVHWFPPSGNREVALLSLKEKFTYMCPIVPELISKFQNTLMFIEDFKKNSKAK